MRNKIKFWRLQLQAKEGRTVTQQEVAGATGLTRESINRWETQRVQPDNDNLVKVWLFYKTYFPDMDLQDLLEWE